MALIRCPLCKADNLEGPACRRCKADLSMLFRLEERRAWTMGERDGVWRRDERPRRMRGPTGGLVAKRRGIVAVARVDAAAVTGLSRRLEMPSGVAKEERSLSSDSVVAASC